MSHKEATIIDGKYYASKLLDDLAGKIARNKESYGIAPKLAIILVGSDHASMIYVRNKINAAKKVGMHTVLKKLPQDVSQAQLLEVIDEFNQDNGIHGIIIQQPLPSHLFKEELIFKIDRLKDVDGFHPENIGLLYGGYDSMTAFIPGTAMGCLYLIKNTLATIGKTISGQNVVVIGRSNIVGKPLASLLIREDATITLCHSKTQNLQKITSGADIVVSAVGKPRFLTADYFSSDAIVIDVGISRIETPDGSKLFGDVDFESAKNKVAFITPVPRGVGPMTIAYLLINTFHSMLDYEKFRKGRQINGWRFNW